MNGLCKHRLPCGWCELKNKECEIMVYPHNFERYEPIEPNTVMVYAAPSGTPPVTWSAERSEE